MTAFIKLYQFEFSRWYLRTALLCLAAFFSPVILMMSFVKGWGFDAYMRFESAFASAGAEIFFYILCGALAFMILSAFYADFINGKSIYTLLSLPISRRKLYFCKLLTFITWLLLLLAFSYFGFGLSYSIFCDKVQKITNETFIMRNGFLLALLRSGFFKLVLPLSLKSVLYSCTLGLSLLCSLLYLAACERAKCFLLPVYLLAYAYTGVTVLSTILNGASYDVRFLLCALGLAGLTVFSIFHGLYLYEKSKIC